MSFVILTLCKVALWAGLEPLAGCFWLAGRKFDTPSVNYAILQVKIGNFLHCTPYYFLKFQMNVPTVFWRLAKCFFTLCHCLTVSLCHWYLLLWNWLGIWLTAHLFIGAPSYISHLPQRSSPQPSSTLWPTFAIHVCWEPWGSTSEPLIYARTSSSPAAVWSY